MARHKTPALNISKPTVHENITSSDLDLTMHSINDEVVLVMTKDSKQFVAKLDFLDAVRFRNWLTSWTNNYRQTHKIGVRGAENTK